MKNKQIQSSIYEKRKYKDIVFKTKENKKKKQKQKQNRTKTKRDISDD